MLDGSEAGEDQSDTGQTGHAPDVLSINEKKSGECASVQSSERSYDAGERSPGSGQKPGPINGLSAGYDHTDYLMDKIDAEIYAMTNVEIKSLECSFKEEEIENLKAQGVEFDSEIETKCQSTPLRASGILTTPSKVTSAAEDKDEDAGTDTGLGSGSADQDEEATLSDANTKLQRAADGRRHAYSDDSSVDQLTDEEEEVKVGCKSDHMELDSDTAEQIEEKFQQIMKKKRAGGYLSKQNKLNPSTNKADDLDSVKTEDFMDKFKETLVGSAPKSTAEVRASVPSQTHTNLELDQRSDPDNSLCSDDFYKAFSAALVSYDNKHEGGPNGMAFLLNKQRELDEDSIRTEDFEKKFKEVVNGKTPPRHPQLPAFLRKQKESDIDSIRTEDFENKYKQLQKEMGGGATSPKSSAVNNVKANLQMMFAQAKKKEAELDSIKTEEFEQKFRELGNPKPKQPVKPTIKKIKPKDTSNIEMSNKLKKDQVHKKVFPFSKEFLRRNEETESLKTEDFEGAFRGTIVKRVAGIPITSFDQSNVDSDIDTVKSAFIHDKFQNALETSLNKYSKVYEESDASMSEPESAVELKYSSQAKNASEINLAEQGVMSLGEEDEEEEEAGHVFGYSDNEEMMQTAFKFDADEGHADDEDEEAREIELESARIQREIVKERVHKMSTPTKLKNGTQASPKFTDRVVGKKHQLKELDDSVQKAREDKQVLMRELKAMKEKLRRHQVDIKMAEKQAKENRTKAEDARTELMLTEFKRDSAKKELEKVFEEINRKKKKAKGIDEKIRAMNKESKDLESMGITKEEVIMIVAENEELQVQARNAHTTELERNELLRQLECTKEELFAEQKRARSRIEALEEEIEIGANKREQSQVESENLHKQLEILDAKYKQVEQEKNNLIEAKSSELNTLQDQTQKQVLNVRKQTGREVTELKQKIVALNEKVGTLRAEISQKDQMCLHLREQVIQLQQELTRETEMKEQLIEENQRNMKTMRSDKDNAITKLKEVAMADKQRSLEELRVMLEKEMNNALTRSDERLTGTITEHQKTIQTKEQEILMLRDRLKSQESSTRQLGEKLRAESQENTRSAISKEREMWEREKSAEWQRKLESMREEHAQSVSQKRAELEAERQIVEQVRKQVAALTEELEDQKCHNRLQYQERTIAINKVKEEAMLEREADLSRLHEKLRKERCVEQDGLKEQLRKQEEEVTQLHAELQRLRLKEQETNSLLERTEKTMVQEVNEECRRIAAVLGVTPRTANLAKSPARNGSHRVTQMAVTSSALANLKACDEELRHYVEELKQEIQSLKQTITRLHRDKDHLEEMAKLHQNVGKDKNAQQLLREKDRELREIQRSMSSWKDGTAEKLAKKFEEELNRELEKRLKEQKRQKREYERLSASQQREIDRYKREVQRLTNLANSHSGSVLNLSATSAAAPAIEDASTARLLQQLQGRVKQLRSENTALRLGGGGGLSSSVPDLANMSYSVPVRESSINRMEAKLSALERRSELAEERAEKNQQMLTGKMSEVSKLQNTLTQQTKELMQLERAYSQLKQQSVLRSPSSRLTSVR